MKIRILTIFILSVLLRWKALSQSTQPNFIIFIADDVSWDDFGITGNPHVRTPTIDSLAENGIRMTNVYLTASSCSPSRNSILTSRYPHNTGAAELHTQPPEFLTALPEVLKEEGYYCVHAGKFHQGQNTARGYDKIYRRYEEINNGGEGKWVESVKERPHGQPFFMWFAALDAHRDWGPNPFSGTHKPEEIDPPFYLADDKGTREDLAQYYDEIYRFDQSIGEVLDVLREQKALENTLIIIMADNGRPFPHSKTRVNDRGMKTPFVVYWPQGSGTESQVSESLVSSIDIAPTLIELAGGKPPESFQGQSFSKLLFNPSGEFRKYLFAEHNWHDYEAMERMARSNQFMYIRNYRPNLSLPGPADAVMSPAMADLIKLKTQGKLTDIQTDVFVSPRPVEELYDLQWDPHQTVNLASHPDYQGELQKMRILMDDWQKQTGDTQPENLTPDWFLKEGNYVKTEQHGMRGEMPGESANAVYNNNKGPGF